jgi:hypothetical protein
VLSLPLSVSLPLSISLSLSLSLSFSLSLSAHLISSRLTPPSHHSPLLSHVRIFLESSAAQHIFQMVQDKYKDYLTVSRTIAVKVYPRRRSVTPSTDQINPLKQAPSSRRRNSAPGAAAIDCAAVYHQQQQQQGQLNAGHQDREEDCGFRPKATFEEINSTRHSE